MRSKLGYALVLSLLSIHLAAGTRTIRPTTTLTAETSSNTSTAKTFTGQINGNIAPANVSKVPLRSLLYPGSTTKIYIHVVPWFGVTEKGWRDHVDVGYDSFDPVQIRRQVNDIQSRGADGVIINWYGPKRSVYDTATIRILREAETRPGFEFAIMHDVGAVKTAADPVAQTISDLNYAYDTMMQSPAYMRRNGLPVVMFFGHETIGLNLAAVKAGVKAPMMFVQRNASAFTNYTYEGAFGWLQPRTTGYESYMGLDYLDYFYKTGQQNPGKETWGSSFKGFNDIIALWAPPGGRHIPQFCGQTWLATWNTINTKYNANDPLPNIQVVTWNDYEEGTALETGIDNCVAVTATVTGNTLNWTIAGGEQNTIDHFQIYITQDGENLEKVGGAPASARSFDLSSLDFAPGAYNYLVRAVGKPSITNKWSNPAPWSMINKAPVAELQLSGDSGYAPFTVAASTAGSTDSDGWITGSSIDFSGAVINQASGQYTYKTPGAYTVNARVTDNNGTEATTSRIVTVFNSPPVARLALSAASGYAPLTVTASTAASSDPDGSIASSTISFGVTTANGTTGQHTYTQPGAYTIIATVTDNNGVTNTTSQAVTVLNNAPLARLTLSATSGVAPLSVSASTIASTDDGTIVGGSISFGNGTVVSGQTGSTVYSTPGTYYVTAIVTDEYGVSSKAVATITVGAPPKTTPVPATGVTIRTPTSGAAVSQYARLAASAYSPYGKITGMKVYVDGVNVYSTISASLDRYLRLNRGARRINVNAWDATGRVFTSAVTVYAQ